MNRLIPCQRDLFRIPEGICYLNCSYMTPLLKASEEAGRLAIDQAAQPWKICPDEFFVQTEELRGLFAKLIRGDSDGVALMPSASYGVQIAAQNIPLAKGQKIIVLEDQFPSNLYAWREKARESDAEIVTVRKLPNTSWSESIIQSLDSSTAIVSVPNCLWTDGSYIDLNLLAPKVRETGAALVVDSTQSLGAHPLFVDQIKPDFLICSGYKWLFGPYALSYLYVDKKFREGRPLEYPWVNRLGSEDLSRLTNYRDEYKAGARRFDMGEVSNFHLVPMGIAGLKQILDWDVEAISESLRNITNTIARETQQLGFDCLSEAERISNIIGLRPKGHLAKDIRKKFAANNIFVSLRGESIRVSPHLHNTDLDLEKFFSALRDIS